MNEDKPVAEQNVQTEPPKMNRHFRRQAAHLAKKGIVEEPEPAVPANAISKEKFKEMLLPKEDDFVEGFRVVYRNMGNLRFTAEAETPPEIGTELMFVGKRYIVEFINKDKNRFSAKFVGFKEYEEAKPLPVVPDETKEEITKVL